jgi:hypothetical protein
VGDTSINNSVIDVLAGHGCRNKIARAIGTCAVKFTSGVEFIEVVMRQEF